MADVLINRFTQALQELCRDYRELHLLLEEEYEQLRCFDTHGLLHTAAAKGSLLGKLKEQEEKIAAYQFALASEWGIAAMPVNVRELISQAPPAHGQTLRGIWRRLQGWTSKVKVLHQRNSAMIAEGLAFCQDALECLQGAVAEQSPSYSPTRAARQRKTRAFCLQREV